MYIDDCLKGTQMLTASDVVWDDLFSAPATAELRRQDLRGINVPDSNFVQTPDLASTATMVPIWERINGSAASGSGGGATTGLHGNGIESVSVIPGGAQARALLSARLSAIAIVAALLLSIVGA